MAVVGVGAWSGRRVGGGAVLDAEDDQFADVFADTVENAVGAPGRGPHASQVVAQRLADPVGLADQWCGQKLHDCCRVWLGQLPGQGAASRRGEPDLVSALACHWRSWRTASAPRMTSP